MEAPGDISAVVQSGTAKRPLHYPSADRPACKTRFKRLRPSLPDKAAIQKTNRKAKQKAQREAQKMQKAATKAARKATQSAEKAKKAAWKAATKASQVAMKASKAAARKAAQAAARRSMEKAKEAIALRVLAEKAAARDTRGPRACPCPHCGQEFSRRGRLMSHLETHAPYKRFPCPWGAGDCTMMFPYEQNVAPHVRRHLQRSEPKPYACRLVHEGVRCTKSFRYPSGLARHAPGHPRAARGGL